MDPIRKATPGFLLVAFSLLLWSPSSGNAVAPGSGAETMLLTGGVTGNVPFPHRRHQEDLSDCKACHQDYPQEPGVIDQMKSEGKLQSKEIMNRQCIACHRGKKREGEATGPTTCRGCHRKD
jgi:hypothetical protein